MTKIEKDKKIEPVQTHGSTKDIYRDTPIRLLGYANEIGEAFRAHIGDFWVRCSYGIATAYVFADTFDKSTKAAQENNSLQHTATVAFDTLIWQMLASVIIPGVTINRLCYFTDRALYTWPPRQRGALVTLVGLLAIPVIIRPIDMFTDRLLDETLRKYVYTIR